MTTIIKVETLDKTCDYCHYVEATPGVPATYDARTFDGRWANLCPTHFGDQTPMNLGTGIGQMFLLPEDTYMRLVSEQDMCPYCLAAQQRIPGERSLTFIHDECCPRVFDVDGE